VVVRICQRRQGDQVPSLPRRRDIAGCAYGYDAATSNADGCAAKAYFATGRRKQSADLDLRNFFQRGIHVPPVGFSGEIFADHSAVPHAK
jgi:hypothetical protein